MTCDRGNFFVGEIAVDCKIDHQTSSKRVKSILRRVTKVRKCWDKCIKKIPPMLGESSCQYFLPLRRRKKKLSAGVLSAREVLIPRYWTVVLRASEPGTVSTWSGRLVVPVLAPLIMTRICSKGEFSLTRKMSCSLSSRASRVRGPNQAIKRSAGRQLGWRSDVWN